MIREKLLSELHSLSQLRTLDPDFVVAMKGLSDTELAFLAESIDDSDYSVLEWLLALMEFHDWQKRNAVTHPLRFQVEYLNCCAQGSVQGGGKLLSLAELFRDYAGLYGVKGGF